jgi:hypothetical protein
MEHCWQGHDQQVAYQRADQGRFADRISSTLEFLKSQEWQGKESQGTEKSWRKRVNQN